MTFFIIEIERIIGQQFEEITEHRHRVAASQEAAEVWLQAHGFRHIHHTLWEIEERSSIWTTIIQAVIFEVPGV